MREEFTKMNEDLIRMSQEKEQLRKDTEEANRQLKEQTERLKADRIYQGEKFTEESLALARTRSEHKKIEQKMKEGGEWIFPPAISCLALKTVSSTAQSILCAWLLICIAFKYTPIT